MFRLAMLNTFLVHKFTLLRVAWIVFFSITFFSCNSDTANNANVSLNGIRINVNNGTLQLVPLSNSAIRVRYTKANIQLYPEEIVYTENTSIPKYKVKEDEKSISLRMNGITAIFNKENETISFLNDEGRLILEEQTKGRYLELDSLDDMPVYKVMQRFISPPDEYLYGTGQFQDDYLNIKGLSRRLTQVNSQISIPFVLSNQGYGLLWNNYGLTELNPAEHKISLKRHEHQTKTITVDATGTSGNVSETRNINQFVGTLNVPATGKYAVMLDVGQAMARKHHLVIDGDTITDVNNIWLPPTTSVIVELEKGVREIVVEGERNDKPVLYWKPVTDETVLFSPVAEALDYTVFAGSPEEIIANYRQLTGQVPMPPKWAFGYIHFENGIIHKRNCWKMRRPSVIKKFRLMSSFRTGNIGGNMVGMLCVSMKTDILTQWKWWIVCIK
jgi:alpha-D-xyloside xylohydrolase